MLQLNDKIVEPLATVECDVPFAMVEGSAALVGGFAGDGAHREVAEGTRGQLAATAVHLANGDELLHHRGLLATTQRKTARTTTEGDIDKRAWLHPPRATAPHADEVEVGIFGGGHVDVGGLAGGDRNATGGGHEERDGGARFVARARWRRGGSGGGSGTSSIECGHVTHMYHA